jgi:hypothetical protein
MMLPCSVRTLLMMLIIPSLLLLSSPLSSSPSFKSYDQEDDEFGDFGCKDQGDGIWCQHGKLFIDGSSSGDVVQVTRTHKSTMIIFETDSINSSKYLLSTSFAGCDIFICCRKRKLASRWPSAFGISFFY